MKPIIWLAGSILHLFRTRYSGLVQQLVLHLVRLKGFLFRNIDQLTMIIVA